MIPVFHEEKVINKAVDALRRLPFEGRLEIIVVDGDPGEQTLVAISDSRVIKARSEKGRGKQMNAGAMLASGEVLLFLHVDTELPPDGLTQICTVMRDRNYVGGSFDLGIGSDRFCFRLIERAASLRSRITKMPYGDQGIFLRRESFFDLGGFRELPLMEDVDLMRRVKQSGKKIHIIARKIKTSARRWEKEGVVYCTFRNWMLILLYLLGVSPRRLARLYPDHSRIR
ncbi:MAG TPA: TIGR04283 family arsenosugar biosynthesis glycosyltransferase [Syntrophorhabdales bacterium]|nr:TIGR04283 family arsenosugar biosynthesis glycosyltransferase [Syntrophorhabdales bacterium]